VSLSDDPWELPSARSFFSEIEGEVAGGGAVVIGGPSLPPDLDGAIDRYFKYRNFIVERIEPPLDRLPAQTLAEAFGATAEAAALAHEARLTDHLAVVVVEALDTTALNGWYMFMRRFLKERGGRSGGLAVLLLRPGRALKFENLPLVAWNGRLRRIDVTIWADLHAPLDRPEPLATLSAALAVDLCGWRLDLAAEIARARRQDLLDPLGWLRLRVGQAPATPCKLNGRDMACPIALCQEGRDEEIRVRIWKAQLTALFPWLELHRQRVIDRHRRLLRIDQYQRELGVYDVDELEFGGLAWQLRNRLGRAEADLVDCFAELRNDLAHRRVVNPASLDRAIREAQQTEAGG
jgi:hypothetical protein